MNYPEDIPEQTIKFKTKEEVNAFFLGFYLAANELIFCGDHEHEPNVVTINFGDEEAVAHFTKTIKSEVK